MIASAIYETHISVSNLERSIHFYRDILQLEFCHIDEQRRIAFFWVGTGKQSMLGLWESSDPGFEKRHFAFKASEAFIVNESIDFFTRNNLAFYNFLKADDRQPMVFAWMPAVAIYFNDPDGNILEFISIIDGTPDAALGVVSYSDWKKLHQLQV